MENDIKYKVVRPGRISSFIFMGPYRLEYQKGKIVKAPKHSMGIFVFDTYKDASDFKDDLPFFEILKVRPIGSPKKYDHGIDDTDIRNMVKIDEYYYWDIFNKDPIGLILPKGTTCYPAVGVLE